MLLSDVLPILARLSQSFQKKKNLSFGVVKLLVDGTKAALQALLAHRGEYMSGLEDTFEKWLTECGVEMPSEKTLSAFAVNVEQTYLQTTIEHLDAKLTQTPVL